MLLKILFNKSVKSQREVRFQSQLNYQFSNRAAAAAAAARCLPTLRTDMRPENVLMPPKSRALLQAVG